MQELRAQSIVRAIGDASERWRNADFPSRVRATRAIETRTGYREPVIDYALDALFGSIDAAAIEAVVATELGSLAALDGFVSRAGRPDVTYVAREPIAIVASDTTIGVAIAPLIFALCTKGHVRVKDRSDGLVRAFVETIREELPALGDAVDVSAWNGADDAAAERMLRDAGAVVAFGRGDALAAIRARLTPEASFTGFGHRTSIAYVTRESLAGDARANVIAHDLARDVLLYDGDGCLSPHAVFCENGGALTPLAFTRLLADACDERAVEFPASFETPEPAAVAIRDAARFRAAQGSGAVFGGTFGAHVVVFEPPRDDAPPLARRTIASYAVDGPGDVAKLVKRHTLPLEAIACTDERADLLALARDCGASRVCAIGALQRPPLGGDHGGTGRILPLVRAIYRA